METKPKFTINRTTKILSPANSYDFNQDSRLLIPFSEWDKIGFMNQNKDVVVKPQFDMYYGECYDKEDLIIVSKIESYGFPRQGGKVSCYQHSLYGIINYKGEILIDINCTSIIPAIGNKTLFTVQNKKYQYGVINIYGDEIIPFGKYRWIDGFDNGIARVISYNKKCGIINKDGEEILPIEYDNIWNFYGKNRRTTKVMKDNHIQDIELPQYRKETIISSTNMSDLNKAMQAINNIDKEFEEPLNLSNENLNNEISYNCYDNENFFYDKYTESYDDIIAYNEELIEDAFEGDPDAYWNID